MPFALRSSSNHHLLWAEKHQASLDHALAYRGATNASSIRSTHQPFAPLLIGRSLYLSDTRTWAGPCSTAILPVRTCFTRSPASVGIHSKLTSNTVRSGLYTSGSFTRVPVMN